MGIDFPVLATYFASQIDTTREGCDGIARVAASLTKASVRLRPFSMPWESRLGGTALSLGRPERLPRIRAAVNKHEHR